MDTRTKEYAAIAACGVVAALAAVALAAGGNPANMAICVACFIRDSAGAMKLQTVETLQYLRPEIIGIVAGAAIMAIGRKEFRATAGSSPATRFFLGFVVMIGALVFLGCPLRMVLRMAGGDLNAWVALAGFAAGIGTGVFFLKKGFSLGRAVKVAKAEGGAFPAVLVVLLALGAGTSLFAASASGPASMHAPIALSIAGGLAFGAAAQVSRMCFAGCLRDTFLVRDGRGLIAVGILFVGVLVYNLAAGSFKLGFADQPIAHSDALWNILGMYVVGFGATLLGGCPLRQLTLAGQGSADSAVTVVGMLLGAAFAHNFGLASSAAGPTAAGQVATVVCIVVLFGVAALHMKKRA